MKFSILVAGLATASAEPLTIKLEGRRLQKRSAVDVELSNWWDNADYQWYGKISVGTPAQEFNVLIDTGSTDLVLPKKGCKHCGNYTTYDASKSSTFSSKPGYDFVASYDTAGNAEPVAKPMSIPGKIVSDTMTIGDVAVENQEFFLADDYLRSWLKKNLTTTFWNLFESGKLSEPVFSMALNAGKDSPSGELTLGGIDTSKYEGELTGAPFNATITAMFHEWFIDTPAFYVDGKSIDNSATNKPFPAGVSLLDTGTAFIQVPDHQTAKDIYAAISLEIKLLDKLGVWGAPCEVMEKLAPELTFTIGAGDKLVNLTMPKDAFNLGEHASHPGKCQAVILHPPEPISEAASVWVIGSPVLKAYYTVWDGGNLEIGVGKLKGSGTGDDATETTLPTPAVTAGAGGLVPCWRVLGLLAGLALL
ncbi:hypothetical protein ACJ41O_015296 [Fusarium nematophilum]